MKRKYVFGPILSRRLGVSLGVDLVTAKTCPQDCIYCEARATTSLTMERREYVPVDEVISELQWTLENLPLPDYITFSGAGEPTLNSRIGDVVTFVKRNYPQCKLCLLTNGVLLGDPALRRDVAAADLVIPSLDASNEAEYRQINRPVAGSTLAKLVDDIAAFAGEFPNRLVLEIFVIPQLNDSDASIARFVELVKFIAPAAIQLNSLDRPGVIADLQAAPPETLRRFAAALEVVCPVEIVRPLPDKQPLLVSTVLEEKLLDILSHRRLTVDGVCTLLGAAESEVLPVLLRMTGRQQLRENGGFYSAVQRSE